MSSKGSKSSSRSSSGLLVFSIGLSVLFLIFPFLQKIFQSFKLEAKKVDLMPQLITAYTRKRGWNQKTSEYIAALSSLETGSWTSNIYRENNNLFGMRCPQIRETTAVGCKNGFAVYESTSDSIEDFLKWWFYNNIPMDAYSLDGFSATLKNKGYYQEDMIAYLGALQSAYRELYASS